MQISFIAKNCWCGSQEVSTFYAGHWLSNKSKTNCILAKCNNCSTVRTVGIEGLDSIEYDNTNIYTKLSIRHINSLKIIRRFLNPGKLIDIGCNTGLLLEEIREINKNIELFGTDFNIPAIKIGKEKGLNIVSAPISSIQEKFDNIILIHVLEHIPDLSEFFNDLERISAKGCIVYVAVPNIDSFNAKRNIKSWGALNPHEHTWHFSKKSLKKVIRHYLPHAHILYLGTSWIWQNKLSKHFLKYLFQGDQVELVIKL